MESTLEKMYASQEAAHAARENAGRALRATGPVDLPSPDPDSGQSPALTWILRQLRPVSYTFKNGADAKNVRFGFIADEIAQVLPQIVREIPKRDTDEINEETDELGKKKGIVYPDLIAVLTTAVKEFSGQMKAMQSRLKTAEMELDRLDEEDPMDDDVQDV